MSSKRKYLIFEDVQKDPSLKAVFDKCANMILAGTTRISKIKVERGYPQWPCFRIDGVEILDDAVFEYYLNELTVNIFDYENARIFSEQMRKLCGFSDSISHILEKWINCHLRDPYFDIKEKEKGKHYTSWSKPEWILKPDIKHNLIPESYFKFACYIAILHLKYGPSYAYITTNEIFWFVTELGCNLPAHMKKHGSGDMPKEVLEYKDTVLSCKANDAFATIKITMKDEAESHYEKALDFLYALLTAGFPRSYSIDFRSPAKNYLAIKKLPKKGVNQLFANAAKYPALHEKIEQYARLAINEDEWYTNLENEHCAMPGTFAVFALGLLDESYTSLVTDYLELCDGEHQGIHGEFVLAYIEKYGFTETGQKLYNLCERNIQYLPAKLIALHKKLK